MRAKLVLLMVVAIAGFGLTANAQLKVAYADVDYIFSMMPESKQVESTLKSHQQKLQSQLRAKYEEYQGKVQALNNMPATTPENVQREKMAELTQLETDIRDFESSAQQSMESKRMELLDPIYEKVGNSIQTVAKENGYDYVLTAGVGGTDIVLYANEQYDISDLILKNLGVAIDEN